MLLILGSAVYCQSLFKVNSKSNTETNGSSNVQKLGALLVSSASELRAVKKLCICSSGAFGSVCNKLTIQSLCSCMGGNPHQLDHPIPAVSRLNTRVMGPCFSRQTAAKPRAGLESDGTD